MLGDCVKKRSLGREVIWGRSEVSIEGGIRRSGKATMVVDLGISLGNWIWRERDSDNFSVSLPFSLARLTWCLPSE